jgi:hypothetical protein
MEDQLMFVHPPCCDYASAVILFGISFLAFDCYALVLLKRTQHHFGGKTMTSGIQTCQARALYHPEKWSCLLEVPHITYEKEQQRKSTIKCALRCRLL